MSVSTIKCTVETYRNTNYRNKMLIVVLEERLDGIYLDILSESHECLYKGLCLSIKSIFRYFTG